MAENRKTTQSVDLAVRGCNSLFLITQPGLEPLDVSPTRNPGGSGFTDNALQSGYILHMVVACIVCYLAQETFKPRLELFWAQPAGKGQDSRLTSFMGPEVIPGMYFNVLTSIVCQDPVRTHMAIKKLPLHMLLYIVITKASSASN